MAFETKLLEHSQSGTVWRVSRDEPLVGTNASHEESENFRVRPSEEKVLIKTSTPHSHSGFRVVSGDRSRPIIGGAMYSVSPRANRVPGTIKAVGDETVTLALRLPERGDVEVAVSKGVVPEQLSYFGAAVWFGVDRSGKYRKLAVSAREVEAQPLSEELLAIARWANEDD